MNKRKILITGITGFIAGHVARYLQNNMFEIHGTSRKPVEHIANTPGMRPELILHKCALDNQYDVANLIREVNPHIVIHLAAQSSINNSVDEIYRNNWNTSFNLINEILNSPYKIKPYFIFASSSAVYGPGYHCENNIPRPISAYGAAKLAVEYLLETLLYQEKLKSVSLRLSTVIGPGATHGVVPAIFNKVLADTETIEALGVAPGSIKQFLYIADLIKMIQRIIEREPMGVVNVGGVGTVSVADIIDIILHNLNTSRTVTWSGTSWDGDIQYTNMDITRAMMTCKWSPQYTSKQAVSETVRSLVHKMTTYEKANESTKENRNNGS